MAYDPSLDHPSVAKEVAKKQRLMKSVAANRGSSAAARSDGLPPGQHRTKKWIVLDLGLRPPADFALDDDWSVRLVGPGGHESLSLKEIADIGMRKYPDQAWHCVTGWSASDLAFDGVPLREFFSHPKVIRAAGGSAGWWKWLMQRSADGYTVPVLREDIEADDGSFFALRYNGEAIPMEHGGPRLYFPSLWGWKSAKWVSEISFLDSYQPGFWEKLGCHPRGRVEYDERFCPGWRLWVLSVLASAPSFYRIVFGQEVWVWVMQMGGLALGGFVRAWNALLRRPRVHAD